MAALGGLGIASVAQAEETDGEVAESAETEATPAAGAGLQDGLWMGEAMGHRNKTYVQIAVSGGAIAGISLLRCDDTVGIGTTAAPIMIERINADQNLDADVVSGATLTSFAVKNGHRGCHHRRRRQSRRLSQGLARDHPERGRDRGR